MPPNLPSTFSVSLLMASLPEVLKRERGCVYCGTGEDLIADHLVFARSDPVAACSDCENSRADLELEQWLHGLMEEDTEHWERIATYNQGKKGELSELIEGLRSVDINGSTDETLQAELEALGELDSELCIYCGITKKVKSDHYLTESLGPVSACKKCVKVRKDRPLEEWLRRVKSKDSERWEKMLAHNEGEYHKLAQVLWALKEESCHYCGADNHLRVDTRESRGEDELLICGKCNLSRGDKNPEEWLRSIQGTRTGLYGRISDHHKERETPVKEHIMTVAKKRRDQCIYCGETKHLHNGQLKVELTGINTPISVCEDCTHSQALKENEEVFLEWFEWVKTHQGDHWQRIVEHHLHEDGELRRVVQEVQGGPARPTKAKPSKAKRPSKHSPKKNGHGLECIYCGSKKNIHQGHHVSKDIPSAPACSSCHLSRKSDKDLKEWLRYVKHKRPGKWEQIETYNQGRQGKVATKVAKVSSE